MNSNLNKLNTAKRDFEAHNEEYNTLMAQQEQNRKKEGEFNETIKLLEQQIRA